MELPDVITKPLEAITSTTIERIRHPFIGAFMTSWTLFNWRPLSFFILSSKTVEEKILYIQLNFADNWYLLIYPLLSAFFYVLILPYLSWIIDKLLQKAGSERNIISLQKQIQILKNQKEIRLLKLANEKAEADFKDQKSQNELVAELEKQISFIKEQSQTDRLEFEKKLTYTEEATNEEKNRFIKLLNDSDVVMQKLRKDKDDEVSILQQRIGELAGENVELTETVKAREERIRQMTKIYEHERNGVPLLYLIKFATGQEVIEELKEGKLTYRNAKNNRTYEKEEIDHLLKTVKFERSAY